MLKPSYTSQKLKNFQSFNREMSRVDEFDVNYPCSTLFRRLHSELSTLVHGCTTSDNVEVRINNVE